MTKRTHALQLAQRMLDHRIRFFDRSAATKTFKRE
jgi:hypothetical protein